MDIGDLVDKAKDALDKNEDAVEGALDKAAALVKERTGDDVDDKVDMAVDKAKDVIGDAKA